MTRWINLDIVVEVRSVSGSEFAVRIFTAALRSELQAHTITLQGERRFRNRPGPIRPRFSIVGVGAFCVSYVHIPLCT
jgi:hypothetical protein